jgi:hypothetical protein
MAIYGLTSLSGQAALSEFYSQHQYTTLFQVLLVFEEYYSSQRDSEQSDVDQFYRKGAERAGSFRFLGTFTALGGETVSQNSHQLVYFRYQIVKAAQHNLYRFFTHNVSNVWYSILVSKRV